MNQPLTSINQPLPPVRRYKTPQYRTPGTQSRSNDTVLSAKISLLRTVAASLMQALEELEDFRLPPLTEKFDFYDEVRRFEILLIRKALRTARGSQVAAAKLLKLNPTTLNSKIKSYQL